MAGFNIEKNGDALVVFDLKQNVAIEIYDAYEVGKPLHLNSPKHCTDRCINIRCRRKKYSWLFIFERQLLLKKGSRNGPHPTRRVGPGCTHIRTPRHPARPPPQAFCSKPCWGLRKTEDKNIALQIM